MRTWVPNTAVLQIKDCEKQSPQVCQIQSRSVEDPTIQDEDKPSQVLCSSQQRIVAQKS